ncbi:MAG: spore germination protein, partial [Firmicutes bacterium]|nr:spore germination protein [Bacillota bacterium]
MPVSSDEIKKAFENCADLSSRALSVGGAAGDSGVTAFYLDGLVDSGAIGAEVFRPLTEGARFSGFQGGRACMDAILKGGVYAASAHESGTLDEVVSDILNGFCVLVFEKENSAIAFETRSGVVRGIDTPKIEKSLKGPKDAFVETLRTNT